jgi:transposase
LDSQSVKAAAKGAAKTTKWVTTPAKRWELQNPVLVDSEGLPMRVVIHSAAIQDRDGASPGPRQDTPVLPLARTGLGRRHARQVEAAVAKVPLLRMEIVKRSDDMKGFVVPPRRWVVERTFSWFGRNRSLAKDFENLAETLATFVTLASIQLALRRLPGRRSGPWYNVTKVAKLDYERTIAAMRRDDEDAPKPVIAYRVLQASLRPAADV